MELPDMAGRLVSTGASIGRLLDLSDDAPGDLGAQPELPAVDGAGEIDASFPLTDARWEGFCCAMASGTVEWRAYMDHVSSRCSKATAAQQASRGMRRAEVRARVSWLIRARNQARAAAVVSGGAEADPGRPMSREAKIREIEALLRDTSLSPADRLRAIEQHNRMTVGADDGARKGIHQIDPADLVEYFRAASEQGVDVSRMAEEAVNHVGGGVDPADRFGGDTAEKPQDVGGES